MKLGKLFGAKKKPQAQKKPASLEIPTVPLSSIIASAIEPDKLKLAHVALPQLVVGSAQSIGMQRDRNEDALFTMTSTLTNNAGVLPIGLFIVADGMGGHKHGEVASKLAVNTIADHVMRQVILPLLDNKPSSPSNSIQEILENSVLAAHRIIMKEIPGSGTTLTALFILGKQMSISHVGDSRLYSFLENGEVDILTRDHSLVMRMQELGHLTPEEASIHPQRNVLYRALGQGEPFSPDISTSPLPNSGHLLLCTDGLWGLVTQGEMAHIIQSNPIPDVACQLLIDAANQSGGPDNVSAILIRLPI